MHARSFRPLILLAALACLGLGLAAPAQAATKSCGTTSAAGVTMRVSVIGNGKLHACPTSRGVIRAYRRTRPTQSRPTGSVRYMGRKWDCYLIRDSSGYNCWDAKRPSGATSFTRCKATAR